MWNRTLHSDIVTELRTRNTVSVTDDILTVLRQENSSQDYRSACVDSLLESVGNRAAHGARTVHMQDGSCVDGYASEEDAQWGILLDDLCALATRMQELDARSPRRTTRVAFTQE